MAKRHARPELTMMVCSRCRNKATRCTCAGQGAPLPSEGKASERVSLKAGARNWKIVRVWTEDELRPVLEAMDVYRWQPARDMLAELLAPVPERETPRQGRFHKPTYERGGLA